MKTSEPPSLPVGLNALLSDVAGLADLLEEADIGEDGGHDELLVLSGPDDDGTLDALPDGNPKI